MRIFGTEFDEKYIVAFAAGSIFGGGFFYVAYKLLTRRKNGRYFAKVLNNNEADCEADLMLPVTLANEYGNCRKICLTGDETASAFLKPIPDHFFEFQEKFAQLVLSTLEDRRCTTALVVGSKTGFLTFQLSKRFTQVKGIEPSFSKVATCYRLQNLDNFTYYFPLEGSLKTLSCTVKSPLADEKKLEASPFRKKNWRKDFQKIEFINCKISHIPEYIGSYELLIVNNCLNDIEDPEKFLSSLRKFVDVGGILIISTDYNWKRTTNLESGFGGLPVTNSFELLKLLLNKDFELQDDHYIQEAYCLSNRTCVISNNHVTSWSRRNTMD